MKIILLTYQGESLLSIPDSAVVKNGNPFFIPDFDSSFEAHPYIAVKICRLGKSIASRFAHRYYEELAPALNISAANLLIRLRQNGLPWTEATGFDKSLPLGTFLPVKDMRDRQLSLSITDREGNTRCFPLSIPEEEKIETAIERVSLANSLKMGDLILIPLPPFASSPAITLETDSIISINADGNVILDLPVR